MIDLHCHILPGIDDGPAELDDSVALARSAARAGIDVIVATPHVSRRYPNDAETIRGATAELNARLVEDEVDVAVLPGAEIALSHLADIEQDELKRLGLGGGSYLLVEPPFLPVSTGIEIIVGSLLRQGVGVVLAHPERSGAFRREPQLLTNLVGAGALTSLTASSLVGRFGEDVRRFALQLIRDGLVHNVASDAHDRARRPPSIASELEDAGFAALCDWLACSVPQAVLEDRDIPPRPPVALGAPAGRAPLWQRLRRRVA